MAPSVRQIIASYAPIFKILSKTDAAQLGGVEGQGDALPPGFGTQGKMLPRC
jgi:hypothetical protein